MVGARLLVALRRGKVTSQLRVKIFIPGLDVNVLLPQAFPGDNIIITVTNQYRDSSVNSNCPFSFEALHCRCSNMIVAVHLLVTSMGGPRSH